MFITATFGERKYMGSFFLGKETLSLIVSSSKIQNFTPVHSQVTKVGESKRPWVKYAPSPSSASPTASCLKRSADELDSSLEVSSPQSDRLRVLFDIQLLYKYAPENALRVDIEHKYGLSFKTEKAFGAHKDTLCC
jgi:hypothetical protein